MPKQLLPHQRHAPGRRATVHRRQAAICGALLIACTIAVALGERPLAEPIRAGDGMAQVTPATGCAPSIAGRIEPPADPGCGPRTVRVDAGAACQLPSLDVLFVRGSSFINNLDWARGEMLRALAALEAETTVRVRVGVIAYGSDERYQPTVETIQPLTDDLRRVVTIVRGLTEHPGLGYVADGINHAARVFARSGAAEAPPGSVRRVAVVFHAAKPRDPFIEFQRTHQSKLDLDAMGVAMIGACPAAMASYCRVAEMLPLSPADYSQLGDEGVIEARLVRRLEDAMDLRHGARGAVRLVLPPGAELVAGSSAPPPEAVVASALGTELVWSWQAPTSTLPAAIAFQVQLDPARAHQASSIGGELAVVDALGAGHAAAMAPVALDPSGACAPPPPTIEPTPTKAPTHTEEPPMATATAPPIVESSPIYLPFLTARWPRRPGDDWH